MRRKKNGLNSMLMFAIIAIAIGVGLRAVTSDGYGKIKVEVQTIGQTPRQYLGDNNPNVLILSKVKCERKYSFAYTFDSSFEKSQDYLKMHPDDAVIMSSVGGSEPTTFTVVFSNRPTPDQNFFRQ